jgi:acyl-CoA thioester hydrolase
MTELRSHPQAPHVLPVLVAATDIDHMGHVNNSIYLRWIEQAVHDHWCGLATPAEFDAFRWVAVRHEIDYRRPAFAGDALLVEVRLTSVKRARAWYATAIRRGTDTLVEAVSCWCCVDAVSQGLTLIPRDILERPSS